MIALIFPGQGSQTIGMGQAVAEAFSVARDTFFEIDDVLSQHLSKIIFEGPMDELTRTDNAQPALMAVSMAIMRVLEHGGFDVSRRAAFVAGHSLGEYTALTAAKMFDLQTCAKLLRLRGQAMHEATPPNMAGMAALLGGTVEKTEELAAAASQGEVCVLANDNSPEQHVISGHMTAITRAVAMAADFGFKRAVPLPVSSAFHSPLMAPAQDRMAQALQDNGGGNPILPVVMNVTAMPERSAETIRANLVTQVTGRVRWCETIRQLEADGVTMCVEVGAGKVLSGLVKRIAPNLSTCVVNTPQDIEDFMKKL